MISPAKERNSDYSTRTASFVSPDFHTESAWENFVALDRGNIGLSDLVYFSICFAIA